MIILWLFVKKFKRNILSKINNFCVFYTLFSDIRWTDAHVSPPPSTPLTRPAQQPLSWLLSEPQDVLAYIPQKNLYLSLFFIRL